MEMSIAEKAFRKLRESWFNQHLYSRSHEREWEDEEKGKLREENNLYKKKLFDEDTEAILLGENRCINPTCSFDIRKGRKE